MPISTNLADQLSKLRHEAEEREAKRRAEELKLPYLDATTAPLKVDSLKLLEETRSRQARIVPFETHHPVIALAAYDPTIPEAKTIIDEFSKRGFTVKVFIVSTRGLEHFWSFYKFAVPAKSPITSRVTIDRDIIISLLAELNSLSRAAEKVHSFDPTQRSITEFLEIVIAGALANRASDIHFEPEEHGIRLRYRVDGLLHDVSTTLRFDMYTSLVSRIKLLSNLKININDRTQDGRFTIGLPTKDIELRVAIAPSEYGEIIVMRVLDPDAIKLTLAQLGLRPDDLEIIETELKRPNGMILNTGPTGSGKTTTLYAFLRSKLNPEIKVITIEDPIEYHLQGIEQTQVNEEAGYTFAGGLRSVMRQDPDVILVGEVRDKDTAEIAIQAALTGHLVLSTVHANEAAGAIPRFLDLGVRPTSIGPALNLIIGQRLVRRLCSQCRVQMPLDEHVSASIKTFIDGLPARVPRADFSSPTLFTANPKGCQACNGFGYKGRVAIYELLLNDPEYEKIKADQSHQVLSSDQGLEALILSQAGEREIEQFALRHGMVTLAQDGILKVLQGITSFSEVEDVTGPIGWLRMS